MIYPAARHFRIRRGVTFEYPFQYLIGDETSGARVDLSSSTAAWVITWNGGSRTLTTGATPGQSGVFFGGQAQDPTNGFITLVLSAADTTTLPWSIAFYTLRVTNTSGTYELLRGGLGIKL